MMASKYWKVLRSTSAQWMKLDTFQSKRSYGKRPSDIKFDSDKFISAIQDIKQGVNERLRQ